MRKNKKIIILTLVPWLVSTFDISLAKSHYYTTITHMWGKLPLKYFISFANNYIKRY